MPWLNTKRLSTFTRAPYAGNPAWVVFGADMPDDDKKLLKLARELNPLSDTTFIFPGDNDADFLFRFFSPSSEIRFSGHGTVAAYFAMEDSGLIKFVEPITTIRQKTKTGLQNVEIRIRDKAIERVTVSLPPPRFLELQVEIKTIANFLNISPVDILDTNFPVRVVEAGHGELLVPFKSLDQLLEIEPNFTLMKNYCLRFNLTSVIVFAMQTRDKESNVHMRNFAPVIGINEDPASGGASTSLGFYLVQNNIVPREEVTRIVVEQGYAMQRPGLIYVHVHTISKDIIRVTFGGNAVVTFEGRVLVP
jgi:PhzF family phenazine biosynthesis protein